MPHQAVKTINTSNLTLGLDVLNNLTDGVYIVDRDRRIIFWNQAAHQITGFSAAQVIGSRCQDDILMHVNQKGCSLCKNGCPLTGVIKNGQPRNLNVFLNHRQGHRVPVHVRTSPILGSEGEVLACVEVFSDDTHRQSLMDQLTNLESQALLDPLTGLANRRHFDAALKASLNKHARHNVPFGLILADIDHFKRFNDYYGHTVGDDVLKLVSRTLASNSRPYDTVSRWGGEEFALIVELEDADRLYQHASRLCHLVANSSLKHDDTQVSVTLSIGVTMIRKKDSAKSIIQRVDELLYTSEEEGRNCVSMG
ncbi:MAG: sensor domain-containing diguanylate cyclase [Phycisphaeraceae bacterium]|nr:sensor domain-containing diguanylate cyclase [Phycisphaeraceae bacterium]